ncbi:glycosyltransferase, partial [Mycobacterium sp. 852002-10029_SCH5224772]|uniref:glycosyltransferase n=1 Tax=Mycobacterium sp. 852002-10029_SCH5224772 TaxID=1834083 RepID=UPI0007FF273C
MRFALASYGTRGDIEPSAAVGRELVRRGHDVRLAVPPELVGFVESTGLAAVPYGPKVQEFLDEEFLRNMWADFFRNPIRQVPKVWDPLIRHWEEVSTALKSLADGADLLSTGLNFEQSAANVAEYYDIPLASLHHFPMRANGHLLPSVPAPLLRSAMTAIEWLFWRSTKEVDNAQRDGLGLPKATRRSQRRIAERRSLEIQAYDDIFFPGLAAEWTRWGDQRPFVGALTMELPTDSDDDVASWIASGTPPICFGSGSIALESAADTVKMVGAACA